jgi:hypothetical protein
MKQEWNHRKVWETSFKNKVIPALKLFLRTYNMWPKVFK